MKVALVIGHSCKSQGASNKNSISEFEYNMFLVHRVKRAVPSSIDVEIVCRDEYKDLPDKINALNPDLVLSFHCNAFNTEVSGSEVLYYHTSETGQALAYRLQQLIVNALGLRDRGIKPKRSEDRGGYLLAYTKAPCLILEPFFIDNSSDLQIAGLKEDVLVAAYVQFLIELDT